MIKHTGIYVNDLETMETFYGCVFHMHYICHAQDNKNELLDDLLGIPNAKCKISKLITDYGKKTGIGDMLELIELQTEKKHTKKPRIWDAAHIAFEVSDMQQAITDIETYGGKRRTDVHDMGNGRLCCFCTEPENNWIELISSKNN